MRENDNEEQGGGCDIDFASILLEIEPGYVVVEDPSGGSRVLYVPPPMSIGDGIQASLGFELDGQDSVLGRPVFLHRRMQIRHLGNLEEYCADPFVRSLLPRVVPLLDPALGALPFIAVIEALRIDPGADVSALVAAVLERRQALWFAATRG
jgi:hypothetical protein